MRFTYSIDDFAEFEQRGEALTTEKSVIAYKQPTVDPGVLPAWVAAAIEKKPKLRERWNGVTDGLKDGSPSGQDLAIANLLALEKPDGVGIEQALRFRRAKAGDDPKYSGYFEQTVGLALDWAAKQKKKSKRKPAKLKIVSDPSTDAGAPLEDATDAGAPLEDLTDAGIAAALIGSLPLGSWLGPGASWLGPGAPLLGPGTPLLGPGTLSIGPGTALSIALCAGWLVFEIGRVMRMRTRTCSAWDESGRELQIEVV